MKVNYPKLKQKATLAVDTAKATKTPFKLDIQEGLIERMVDLFGQIQPKAVNGLISASGTIEAMARDNYTVTDAAGDKYTAKEIGSALMLGYIVPRGSFSKVSQTKAPRLGALTPLAMYALKERKGIGYNEWDKEDKDIKFFLGRGYLEQLVTEPAPKIELSTEEVMYWRNIALRVNSGKSAGTIRKVTAHNMQAKTLGEYKYSKTHMILLLQTWLANASLRDTSSMLLDPWDWDRVPEAVDQVTPIAAEAQEAPKDSFDLF